MRMLCSCCMAEITQPVFVKGKAYGYSCARKMYGKTQTIKRSKGLWLKADSVEITKVDWKSDKIVAKIGDTRFVTTHHHLGAGDKLENNCGIIDGLVNVAKHSNGTDSIWKHVDVEQFRDEKGKLHKVNVINNRTSEVLKEF